MFPAHQRLTGEDKRGREGGMEAKYPSKATSVNRCHIHCRRRGRRDDKDCKSSLSSFHSPLTDCHKRLPANTWRPLTTTIDHPDHQPQKIAGSRPDRNWKTPLTPPNGSSWYQRECKDDRARVLNILTLKILGCKLRSPTVLPLHKIKMGRTWADDSFHLAGGTGCLSAKGWRGKGHLVGGEWEVIGVGWSCYCPGVVWQSDISRTSTAAKSSFPTHGER